MHAGSCLCGAITFTVAGDLPPPAVCHCSQCRKQSGHCFASTEVPTSALTIADEHSLAWFQSSEKARRGFCASCGSTLFWAPLHDDKIAVAMGAFDKPTGTTIGMHIYVADKGDYYDITDGLPQRAAS
ncbi:MULTISPECIES: GFA family protein [unclassified Sphingomonas]|uniref:GFA family protein n=1 Tax=unclassified Sphingomonas TaxID=196159 RepID=UPI000928D0C5|nr:MULTISPECIES: GFA family protein [unclassified Sphingomonas]OJU16483.1 MAG: aldehyde-activating protein [Sphingomonas sp. 66-10]